METFNASIMASPPTVAYFAAMSQYFDRVMAGPDESGRTGHTPDECPDRIENVAAMLTAACLANKVRTPELDNLSEFFGFLQSCHGVAIAMRLDIPEGLTIHEMVYFLTTEIAESSENGTGHTIN